MHTYASPRPYSCLSLFIRGEERLFVVRPYPLNAAFDRAITTDRIFAGLLTGV